MAVRQSKISEIRYMKRKNLEQEARILGNMYRDQIHQQGIDCTYHKLNMSTFEEFKGIVDNNLVARRAYGYDDMPDYSISADIIAFMEVENDIFLLNKYGLNPNMDVNFVFDSNDFACALAEKMGQYKEYKIDETEIVCEVPDSDPSTSADVFPYMLGLGYNERFFCKMLSGKLSAQLNAYQYGVEYTVRCNPYEHTDFQVSFPVNKDILKSFNYKIKNTEYIDSMLLLTFVINRVKVSDTRWTSCLSGRVHGSLLFYDMDKIGKYAEKIHPDVGDVVTIDFPDEKNRELYEITEAVDKQMTQDGINPFMHKYVWKCKARRYVNSYEDMEDNEGNDRLQERLDLDKAIDKLVVDVLSKYTDNEDAAYGGYDIECTDHDSKKVDPKKRYDTTEIADGAVEVLMEFACGSKLVTNGYDLYFVDGDSNTYRLAADTYLEENKGYAFYESGLRFLKATDNVVVFVNIEGRSFSIAEDREATLDELLICLNSLYDKTLDDLKSLNRSGDTFFKFKGTKTFLFATRSSLFCHLASGKMTKLV